MERSATSPLHEAMQLFLQLNGNEQGQRVIELATQLVQQKNLGVAPNSLLVDEAHRLVLQDRKSQKDAMSYDVFVETMTERLRRGLDQGLTSRGYLTP